MRLDWGLHKGPCGYVSDGDLADAIWEVEPLFHGDT